MATSKRCYGEDAAIATSPTCSSKPNGWPPQEPNSSPSRKPRKMTTFTVSRQECFLFPEVFAKPVVMEFDQQQGSSDGGAVLLKAAERRYGLVARMAGALPDERQAGKVDHSREDLFAQRVFSIACGYPDANDSARLGSDPVYKMLLGRNPVTGLDMASQPTLSRFENAAGPRDLSSM